MPLEVRIVTGLAIALTVVYWATPLAIRVADRFEFYDKPAGYKGHGAPTPYLGGSALIAGFGLALAAFTSDWSTTVPVLAGVLLLWVVGTIDDRRNVAWWARVIVELGLAAVLWSADLGWDLGLGGAVDLLFTMAWVVGVVNAFNLFDNMDGQAATMGLVTAVGLCAFGVATHHGWLSVAAAALAGACFGFLPHNLLTQPARIFLGDGGSMPLGFAVAALAMIGTTHAAASWQALALGLLLVGIPALDTTLVVVSRRRRGISVLTGGQDHLTHRARRRLRTALAVALALGSAQIVLSLLALAASRGSTFALGGVAILYVVGLGVAVALIDNRIPAVAPEVPAPAAPAPAQAARPRWRRLPWQLPLLAVVGIGAGISPLFSGYYNSGVWGPMGLGLIVALLATTVASPRQLTRPAWLALISVAGLGLWSIASSLWADSIQQAVLTGNRTLMLAATLALLLVLVRDRRTAEWALGIAVAAGMAIMALIVVRLLGPDAGVQFLGGRLHQPLGYINAQATFSIMLLWPLLALAERRKAPWLSGLAMFGAVLCAGFVLLSQSRGGALAVIGSALVVLGLCPGRLRRCVAIALAGGAVLAVSPSLLDIYRSSHTGVPSNAVVHHGMLRLLLAAAAAGLAWFGLTWLERSLTPERRRSARRATAIVVAAALAATTVVALLSTGRIADEARHQYDAFVHLGVTQGGEPTASRLLSGAGTRYDYWRIALRVWKDHPVLGVGAGNYDEPYFVERSTVEDIRQPHSMLLQALSELGLPGVLLALGLFVAVGWGAWRLRGAARTSPRQRVLLVGAAGTFTAWAVHTQVDWIHLLPGVTALACVAAAVLLRPIPGTERRAKQRRRERVALPTRVVVGALVALPLAIAGVSLSREVLSEHYRGAGRVALARGDVRLALHDADRALRLDHEDVPSYYLRAAGLARLGDADAAKAALLDAVRREPGDFLTYALLGDLAVRRHRFTEAQRYYREALARNPREPSIIRLARDPRSAVRQ